jgi:hypothetical protein
MSRVLHSVSVGRPFSAHQENVVESEDLQPLEPSLQCIWSGKGRRRTQSNACTKKHKLTESAIHEQQPFQ